MKKRIRLVLACKALQTCRMCSPVFRILDRHSRQCAKRDCGVYLCSKLKTLVRTSKLAKAIARQTTQDRQDVVRAAQALVSLAGRRVAPRAVLID